MNIHEYQGKALLKGYGLPVADGVAIFKRRRSGSRGQEAARAALCREEPDPCRRPRQGPLQGARPRRQGRRHGWRGRSPRSSPTPRRCSADTLVTKQTGPAGKQVNRLYIEDGADIARELYLSLLVDRSVGRVAFVVSTEGGMDIEAVAHDTPEKIITVAIDPETGVTAARRQGAQRGAEARRATPRRTRKTLFPTLYKAFVEKDMSLLEVNPLIVLKNGRLRVLDAKISFDDNAAVPPSRTGGAARPLRRGRRRRSRPRSSTSPMSRSTAISAAWSTAPASPWRRWTSSSSTAPSRRTSSMSAAAPRRKRSRRPSRSSPPTRPSKASWSTSSAASCVRHHRRGRHRRGQGGRAEGAAGGAPRRHQCRARQEDPHDSGLNVISADDLDDAAKKIVAAVKGG